MAPPPLYPYHNSRSYMQHFHTTERLPMNSILLCTRRQRGSYVRGPPPRKGKMCADCLRESQTPCWEHAKGDFEAHQVSATQGAMAIIEDADTETALADDEAEEFEKRWGPGRRLREPEFFDPCSSCPVLPDGTSSDSRVARRVRGDEVSRA